jgi:hypothetical protein
MMRHLRKGTNCRGGSKSTADEEFTPRDSMHLFTDLSLLWEPDHGREDHGCCVGRGLGRQFEMPAIELANASHGPDAILPGIQLSAQNRAIDVKVERYGPLNLKHGAIWADVVANGCDVDADSFSIADGRTTVPLHFGPWGTVFAVFRKPTRQISSVVPGTSEAKLTAVDGPWTVSFQSGRGAPAGFTFDKLISWPDSSDTGVKCFSGYAIYKQTIQAPPDWFNKSASLWIDLATERISPQ